MKPKKITWQGEERARYIPPILFPKIGHFQSRSTQREYVRQCMMSMAGYSEDGDEPAKLKPLCVTEFLAQPSMIRNICGRIIAGIAIDDETHREVRGEPLPARMMSQEVIVTVIDDRAPSVRFKRRVVDDPRRLQRLQALPEPDGDGANRGGYTVNNKGFVKRMVDEFWDYETRTAHIDLADAWVCLSKHGEFCRPCKQSKEAKYWLYREVDEDGDPMINHREKLAEEPEPEKRGPGRPRKIKA